MRINGFFEKRLLGYLAGLVPAQDESLAEHDAKYHPDGYGEGFDGFDPSQPRAVNGRWVKGGARQREHRDKGFQDRYGNGNPETLAANPKMNIERGKAVFTRLARKQTGDEPHAMYRKDIGWIGVGAGKAGNVANEYHGGSGIDHILSKHPGAEKEIAEVIQYGTVYHHAEEDALHPNFRKLAIAYGNNIVIVSKFRDGRAIITSFDPGVKVDKKTGEQYIDAKDRERCMEQITSRKQFGRCKNDPATFAAGSTRKGEDKSSTDYDL